MAARTPSGRSSRKLLRIIIPAYPAFNIYSAIARITSALGPVSVATAVNDIPGWDAEVIDENNYRRGPKGADGGPDHAVIQQMRPAHAIGLYGGLTSTIPRLLEVAELYSKLGVPTIAGGQHFADDTIPEALDHGVDVVVIGEGEKVIAELLEHIEGRKGKADIRGIAYRENGTVTRTPDAEPLMCFDELPIPDFSLVRNARIKLYPVGRVRGCGMNCEFCTVKGRPRYASPERLMQQFASLFEKLGARKFFIVDDLFGQDRAETLRLCQLLRDYQKQARTRFSITVQIRLDKAKDSELLEAMRDARIGTVAIGFESPIAEELDAMSKHLRPEDMIAMTRLYRRAGFCVHGMFIFGYPAQPGHCFQMAAPERVRRFRAFIKKSHLDTVQVLLPVPLPGTELTRRLREQGRIFSKDIVGWEYYDGNFPLFEPDEPLTPEEMQASIQKIMGRFYRRGQMFSVGLHTLSIPVLIFWFYNIRAGWQLWIRRWWKNVMGFGGSRLMRKWAVAFKKSDFPDKLRDAEEELRSTRQE
jgi:radical SAM superfamily enzyme YgiQ (UPF0313 family)